MKKSTVITALTVCFLTGVLMMGAGKAMGYEKDNDAKYPLIAGGEKDLAAAKGFKIDGYSMDVNLRPSAKETYDIETFSRDADRITYTVNDGVLLVSQKKCSSKSFKKNNKCKGDKVNIYFPASCGSAVINLSSGDTDIDSLACKTLKINTSSGDVEIKNGKLGASEFTFSSGDYSIKDTVITSASFSGRSGDVEAEGLITGGLKIKLSSGDIELQGTFAGTTELETTSGDIEVHSKVKAEEYILEASLSSGSIYIDGVKKGKSYYEKGSSARNKMTARAGSGKVELEFAK